MRNLSRSLTHIRVYKIILRKFVSLLTTTVLLANSYLPYFAYGLQPSIAHADAPPALSVSFDKAKNEFEISVNTSSEVEYVLAYTRTQDDGYQVEGLEGKGADTSGIYKKKLFAGTCSASDCIDHEVKRVLVKVQVKDLSWAYEHRYILEVNKEFSLVGEGKIENDNDVINLLELTEENTKWLNDVNTPQPSLTPTPTYAPPTSTPTEIPTPTEVVTIPPVEVTQVVTETPTPTPTVVEPEHTETLTVVVQETTKQVEPSFLDTVLSTLLPFLFTDKPDYAPTEKAVISGKEFLPYSTYFITISSSDNPPVSFTDTLTTTEVGAFEYTYQLDGTYRPNYAVEVKDGSGVIVAQTTFTDGISVGECGTMICTGWIDVPGGDDICMGWIPGSSTPGVACTSDGNACTADVCGNAIGECTHVQTSCDDGDVNTIDSCDNVTGCSHAFNPSPGVINCPDGNACTTDSFNVITGIDCQVINNAPSGMYPRQQINCDDGNALTSDSCNPAVGCVYTPVSQTCDDVNACTGNDVSLNGGACAGQPITCDDSDASTSDTCVPASGCVFTPIGIPTDTPTNTPTPSDTDTPTPTFTPTPTLELQCKNENAECDINNSGKECCEGLICTLFNPASGNAKCLPEDTPTPTNTPTPTPIVPGGRCGDGTVNQQSEQCDDGNQNDTDYCNNQCVPNPNVCLPDVNMLSNGDFETPVVTNGAQWDIFNIFTPFIGWIPNWLSGVTSFGDDTRPDLANIELHKGVNGWSSASGAQHTELDSDWMGPSDNTTGEPSSVSLSQSLMTIPGYKYEVKFAYSPRPGAAAGDNVMKFDFGSNSETYGPLSGGIDWTNVTKEYVADSSPTTISFSDIGTANSEGMFLDNVSVKCIGPENSPTPTPTNTPTNTPTPAPYCGDGIVNGTEECDNGLSLVAGKFVSVPGNFCTSACKLVHVYTGTDECSVNTNHVKVGDTVTVGSRDADGVTLGLTSGKEYLFKVNGTYSYNVNASGNLADGAYGTNTNWSSTRSDIGIWGTNKGVTSLLGDLGSGIGVILWDTDTTLNVDHAYQFAYTPTTGSQQFVISDWYSNWYGANCQNQSCMSDNDQGGLNLEVYECVPKPVSIMAQKVICDAEQYLPNDTQGDITATTAQDWVSQSSGHCRLATDWSFQWAPAGAGSFGAFQSDTSSLGSPWTTFTSGQTVEIADANVLGGRIETREVFPNNTYVPFSNAGDVSAEFYCTGDTANYDNWEWLNSPQPGSTYYCVAFNAPANKNVTVCKVDQNNNPLQGWKVGLSQPIGFDEQIPVTSGAGINANLPEDGAYVVYASGTYRYGNSAMIADAGYSFRPVGIPYGTGGWVNGDDLLSVPGALELKIAGANIDWGGFNAAHEYSAYLTGQPAGNLNLAIWDDNYGDNANNGDFRASIDKQKFAGFVGQDGCVTFTDVPHGDYHVFEAPVADWSYVSTTVGSDTITNYPANVTVGDSVPEITLKNKFVGTGIIRIVKDVMPDDNQTKFDYTLSNTDGYSVSDKVWEGNPSGYVSLLPGTYTLTETDLSGYVESISCSNGQTSETSTITFALQVGDDVVCTITNSQYGSFAGMKYIDVNANGQFDNTDTTYEGWKIELYKHDGTNYVYLTETTTDSLGNYIFENLLPGMYKIAEDLSGGEYVATDPNTFGLYNAVLLNAGENLTGYDFGNYKANRIWGYKYEDLNANGAWDGGESGLPNWTIYLDDNLNNLPDANEPQTTTDSTGMYEFTGLLIGQYHAGYMVREVIPEGWILTYPAQNGVWKPTHGGSDERQDFGNFAKGDMEVMKYEDLDNVLGKSVDEQYIGTPTFTFRVYKDVSSVWTKVGESSTDSEGKATFTDVFDTVGSYFVCEVKKEGWEDMRSLNNPDNNLSGASDEYPTCEGITVSTSGYKVTPEFGNIQRGEVKVYKFHDLNANGNKDDGEPTLADWEITMSKDTTTIPSQTTDVNGSTTFSLIADTYQLDEVMKPDWYQSNIYCENEGEGVKITQPGYAYGHHGACSGWNTCGNAQTCAQKACEANGYSNLVSYGDARPCTQFTNCSLFYDINTNLSYQANWGNWCNVMGVTDIVCNTGTSVTPTPFSTPTPTVGDDQVGLIDRLLGVSSVFAQVNDDNNESRSGFAVTVVPGGRKVCYVGNYQKGTITVNKNVINHVNQDIADDRSFDVYAGDDLGTNTFSENSPRTFTVNPGTYAFQEINIDDRYFLDSTVGDEDSGTPNVQITVNSGSSKSVTFVNKKVQPVLQISKFNNKWPTPTSCRGRGALHDQGGCAGQ
jgi:cysteine-rich repeat protein